ncbi:YbfB/YjiJ family MFS transporter [Halomonas daqingensis]|uniref:YbfB/YjiJ family MFS transporter n=1 Tax=Billgrantia desiderata TaxID=52021 RepID=A0AAW4YM06_9GAMM|nr:YbfB/YjiJ family MFS transporter [Halomonas desiderata]MCE8049821.1 YbfB/YjiJ family MFS transporter [Halomonas desiderata]
MIIVVSRSVIAAVMAVLVGVGLSRFAYSPLIPAIIEKAWLTPAEAVFLGAVNLAGYLIGALGGRWSASLCSTVAALRAFMLLASLSFMASAFPHSYYWLFVWRLISGVSGGALMVLAAPTVLPRVPASRRGAASGVIFTGVGIGIVLSGTIIPVMLNYDLVLTWLVLGFLSLFATGLAWFWWPKGEVDVSDGAILANRELTSRYKSGLAAIYASYGFIALGLVPHMVFLVDYIARGLSLGIVWGGRAWVFFGLGALLGPLIAGKMADSLGYGASIRCVLVIHFFSVGLLAFDHSNASLIFSSILVGSAVSGTVPLILGQIRERVSSLEEQRVAWGFATAIFALGQAGGGYLYSYLFSLSNESYSLVFLIGSFALVLSIIMNCLAPSADPKSPSRAASPRA